MQSVAGVSQQPVYLALLFANQMKKQDLKQQDSDQVRDEKPAFPWLVTPNFFFCFLLLLCMFVPGFKSCGDQTVYIGEALVSPFAGFTNMPQLVAIVVLVATWLWCIAPETGKRSVGSKFAGRSFFVLAVVNLLVTVSFYVYAEFSQTENDWKPISFFVAIVVYATVPAIACLIICFSRRSQFVKASLMQLVISLAGIASAVYFLPAFVLAGIFYMGGKLNIVGVFGLLFMSVLQLMDGERALNRKRGEPIVRLTLKQSFLLMTVGCVLCSLTIGLLLTKPPSTTLGSQIQAVNAEE